METGEEVKARFAEDGFTILSDVFSDEEVEKISDVIESASVNNTAPHKSTALFAIRRVLKEIPELISLIFNSRFCKLINDLFGKDYFVVKSIYFDKPAESNWFVAYHQDLTIAVDKKLNIEGFSSWTIKQNQYAVQPPVSMLQDNFTIRIHLDKTGKNNGALKVIPGSHVKGMIRPETLDIAKTEKICEVKKGGIMIMRPLLLHASNRTTNALRRRVIHIEFSNCILPEPLQWSEYTEVNI